MPTATRLAHRLLLLLAAFLGGCDSDPLAEPDFGDAYRVLVRSDAPGSTGATLQPVLDGPLLRVTVRYGGGCLEHDLTLRHRRVGRGVQVWLHHDAHNDRCEALVTETLTRPLPPSTLDAETIVLLAPDGRVFPLR